VKRWGPVATAVLAVLGAFGLVQIKLVSISPPLWATVTVAVLSIVLIGLVTLRSKRGKLELPDTVGNLEANRARLRKRPYVITSKEMYVNVAPGSSVRRDAEVEFILKLRNRSRRPLGEVELPLLGEVPTSGDDLAVTGRAGAQKMALAARVDSTDHLSPVVKIVLPAPALPAGESIGLSFQYVWPGVAHILRDDWIFDLLAVQDGTTVRATLAYPAVDAQYAEMRSIGRQLGARRTRTLGTVDPVVEGSSATVEIVHTKERGEELLQITTRPLHSHT
jgi:hypothetical protein